MTSQTTRSYGAAIQQLASAQKTSRGTPAYSRWINRPAGRRLAAAAYRVGLNPNQVTALSGVSTLSGLIVVMLVSPSWLSSVLVVLLLTLGYALDSADGQLARLTGLGSYAGEWLDHVSDAVKVCLFHLAVAIAWFRFFDLKHAGPLLIPLGFALLSSVFFFMLMLTDMLRRVQRTLKGASGIPMASVNPNEAAPTIRSFTSLVNDYGLLCLLMILTPLHRTFEISYTVIFAGNVLFLLAGFGKWFCEMKAADVV